MKGFSPTLQQAEAEKVGPTAILPQTSTLLMAMQSRT